MSEILLTRQNEIAITDADREAVRRVVYGAIDGVGEAEKRKWRRFWNMLLKLEPGEVIEIRTHRERLGWFHRKHMVLEVRVFESQERFDHFEQFRNWLKIGAGHCDWLPGPKGAVVPIPRSISYAKLDQSAMEEVHESMVAFLRSPHAAKVLWPKVPEPLRATAAEAVLAEFGAFAE